MATRRFIPFIAVLAFALAARPAHATFHVTQIEQVIGGVGGNTNAQAIQLRMRTSFQNQVQNARIYAHDAAGLNPVLIKDMTNFVSNSTTGDHVLITSTAFQSLVNPVRTPDFSMTNLIPASYLPAGSLTFEDDFGTIYWRVSWGGAGYTGTGATDFTNDLDSDANPAFAGPLPSTSTQALRFTGTATAASTNSAADYAVTAGAAVFTNNARQSETVLASPLGVGSTPSSRLSIELGAPNPNPARSTISYAIQLPAASHVLVSVFAASGQRVRTLIDRELPAGRRDYTWDIKDQHGERVASGAYYIKLATGGVERSQKVMVVQ
jgi:hypothetical protein